MTSVVPAPGYTREQVLRQRPGRAYSNHPIARSILTAYGQEIPRERINSFTELPGRGVQVETAGHTILAGTDRLMRENGVMWQWQEAPGTVVHVAIDGQYAGHVVIADELKADAASALQDLKKLGVKHLVMMTGDRQAVAAQVAEQLPLDGYYAELLPQDKVARIEEIVRHKGKGTLVFVGDGLNDAPVLARADVGVAMGGLGADAAIEAADVTIMTDEPASRDRDQDCPATRRCLAEYRPGAFHKRIGVGAGGVRNGHPVAGGNRRCGGGGGGDPDLDAGAVDGGGTAKRRITRFSGGPAV